MKEGLNKLDFALYEEEIFFIFFPKSFSQRRRYFSSSSFVPKSMMLSSVDGRDFADKWSKSFEHKRFERNTALLSLKPVIRTTISRPDERMDKRRRRWWWGPPPPRLNSDGWIILPEIHDLENIGLGPSLTKCFRSYYYLGTLIKKNGRRWWVSR